MPLPQSLAPAAAVRAPAAATSLLHHLEELPRRSHTTSLLLLPSIAAPILIHMQTYADTYKHAYVPTLSVFPRTHTYAHIYTQSLFLSFRNGFLHERDAERALNHDGGGRDLRLPRADDHLQQETVRHSHSL